MHTLTHSRTHARTHALTHSLTVISSQETPHAPTLKPHSLTHSQIYIYTIHLLDPRARIVPPRCRIVSDSEIDPDMPALSPLDGGCAVCDELAEAAYLRDDEFILDKLDEPELVQPEDVLEEVAGVHCPSP